MIDTVMFDLDGTLLPVDTDKMIMDCFMGLSKKLSNLFEPQFFQKMLFASSMEMINNLEPDKTNEEVFFDSFLKKTKYPKEKLMPIFDDFYQNDYKSLGCGITADKYVKMTLDLLKERGYDIILATNPVFPKVAIKERLKWAGVDEKYFSFITSYEIMHFCKPYIEYYKEIIEKLNKKPENCIMIGNDVDEDIISSEIGLKTFLVEDFMINKSSKDISSINHGNYKDMFEFVNKLPYLNKRS
ncbi:HAD family hydrolase [Thermoanaerobacterium sp. RBIITD]|uniref:HAD family hydrolase n=1 Tax=Thermoanaerobacterium sp. RBIITD TaxID=1550240 RepID=UPI000BB8CBC5|nr:HAD family hydrolase [Thermoanaerobacterium sp. RBIITD]SNX55221.1 FMN phosphatase YigB, HAD superfamily [Thermoanaerobacterium sp. RBIITD]